MHHHVVMFSGGLGSWLAARRVRDNHYQPGDTLTLLFADVAGDNTGPHTGEDADTYRFIDQASADVLTGIPNGQLVTVKDGRDIWQVFNDDHFIGNTRISNCSRQLKQKPARDWLTAHCPDPTETTVYVGIDWTEQHRLPAIVKNYYPYKAEAPLTRSPYLDRDDMAALCEKAGIPLPRLYRAGFPHNNCGGFCVRAGQAQFALLLREHPERYKYHEAREAEFRARFEKDVSIMRDRTGGETVPLTLERFRHNLEAQGSLFDPADFGGCGCFTDEGPD
jgi:hypothetical protein